MTHASRMLLMMMAFAIRAALAQAPAIVGPDTVSFTSGALTLRGVVYRPAAPGRHVAILFNHGSGKDYTKELAAVGPAYARLGYVFFAPSRRGQWLSAATGHYVIDSLDAVEKAQGLDARNRMLVTLMKGEQLDDVRAGLTWLKRQPWVDGAHVVVAGNSYGGIVTMYAAAYLDGIVAALDFAGAAQSWKDSPPLQQALKDVAAVARVPVFFGQAENDYDLTPSRELSRVMRDRGLPHEVRIFPPFGTTTPEGHSFGYFGSGTWGPAVQAFIANPPRR